MSAKEYTIGGSIVDTMVFTISEDQAVKYVFNTITTFARNNLDLKRFNVRISEFYTIDENNNTRKVAKFELDDSFDFGISMFVESVVE